jgi:hypothetical protein
MVEIVKWAGLVFLVVLAIGVLYSKQPKKPTDLPNSWIFWFGLWGCIATLVTNTILDFIS